MRWLTIFLPIFCGVLLTAALAAPAQERLPDVTDADRALLKTLRPGHPRLIGLPADLDRVKRQIESDPVARLWHRKLRAAARPEPPVVMPTQIVPKLAPRGGDDATMPLMVARAKRASAI